MPTDFRATAGGDGTVAVDVLQIGDTAVTSTAAELNLVDGAQRIEKIVKVALGVADTAGGILSWANPESSSIIITRIELNVTTKTTGACTADVGTTATSATTLSDNLIDGLDINAAIGLFSNLKNAGTNGKADQLLAAAKWITASTASGAAAGLVGFAYIHYVVI